MVEINEKICDLRPVRQIEDEQEFEALKNKLRRRLERSSLQRSIVAQIKMLNAFKHSDYFCSKKGEISNPLAARLQATRVLAGAEQKDAQGKVDAFQTRRHFWKFHVEGFGKLSLREVEQKIKTETEEKFKLYNFLRPTKREAIQLKIEFLQETKKDIQKQIAVAE